MNDMTFEFRDIIVDMDGTLANISKRLAMAKKNPPPGKTMDWDIFLDKKIMELYDTPNEHVVHLVKMIHNTHNVPALINHGEHRIIITSARNERHREVTTNQLLKWGINFDKLYLRADDDFRPDEITKAEIFNQILADGYMPRIAIDDRNKVVKMWRGLGLHCWQVEETDV